MVGVYHCSAPGRIPLSPAALRHGVFAAAVGDVVPLDSADTRLADVTAASTRSNADCVSDSPFDVAPQSPIPLEHGTHDVHRPAVRRFPLLLVPVGLPVGGRHTHEADCNGVDEA